jgi:hypothetical protein
MGLRLFVMALTFVLSGQKSGQAKNKRNEARLSLTSWGGDGGELNSAEQRSSSCTIVSTSRLNAISRFFCVHLSSRLFILVGVVVGVKPKSVFCRTRISLKQVSYFAYGKN